MPEYSHYLKDINGNISIIYTRANDGSYNQIYGISGEYYTHMIGKSSEKNNQGQDISGIPFIGYKDTDENNLVFYNNDGVTLDMIGINQSVAVVLLKVSE